LDDLPTENRELTSWHGRWFESKGSISAILSKLNGKIGHTLCSSCMKLGRLRKKNFEER